MGSNTIHVFEVGPRDGLQNEPKTLSLDRKRRFVAGLIDAGIRDIEVGAFVRPDRVPQMAETDRLYANLRREGLPPRGTRLWSLVPNRRALDRAFRSGATHLAVFTAATETFTRRNIGMSITESLQVFSQIIEEARQRAGDRIRFRGYVSTAFGCPFEGRVRPAQVLRVVERLARLDVDQISIGDTIGVATPGEIGPVLEPALRMLGKARVAGHFHDTRGIALANALRALDLGVTTLDSSAGGLGGCPFAPGASGNLATEDLLYMLHGLGLKSGIDLDQVCQVSMSLARHMKRPITSRYLQARMAESGCRPR